MINIIFRGGLGNQFFQYAYAKYLQRVMTDTVNYSYSVSKYEIKRDITIKKFNIDSRWNDCLLKDIKSKFRLRILISNLIEKSLSMLRIRVKSERFEIVKQKMYAFFGMYLQNEHIYILPPKTIAKNKYVDGLWHHPIYCNDIREELLSDFILKDYSEVPCDLLTNIKTCESVAVHIRRGDYLNYSYYLVCSINYYKRAISKMRELHPDVIFFVFSDDIIWVKENLNEDVFYIEGNNPDYVDMELMRNCKHFIISNSTFSWWGAYLGQAENKTVISPDKWYNDGRNKEWLNLPGWIVMETEI